MSFGKLEIEFDKPKQGVYYTGSRVKGYVNIVLTTARRVKAFSIRIRGKAAVHWSRKSKCGDAEEICTGEEIYFEDECLPLGEENPNGQVLSAGSYAFPFNWKVPEDIPSSFMHEHGFVRYTIRAAVQYMACHLQLKSCIGKTWREDVQLAEFPVINILPQIGPKPSSLTKPLSMHEKVQVETYKEPVLVRMTLKQCGVTPGAMVLVTIDINNQTEAKIDRVDFRVLKIFVFQTEDAIRERHAHIFSPRTYKVRPENVGDKVLRATEQFQLPCELWFINLADCNLIKVHFQCMADLWLAGVRKGLAMSLPLVLVNDNTFPLMKTTPTLLKEAEIIEEEPTEEKVPDDVKFLVREQQNLMEICCECGEEIQKFPYGLVILILLALLMAAVFTDYIVNYYYFPSYIQNVQTVNVVVDDDNDDDDTDGL